MTKHTHFHVADAEALAVLIRFANCCGGSVIQVLSVNSHFVVTVDMELEVTSETNFAPFTEGVDRDRSYWAEIATVQTCALEYIGIRVPETC